MAKAKPSVKDKSCLICKHAIIRLSEQGYIMTICGIGATNANMYVFQAEKYTCNKFEKAWSTFYDRVKHTNINN